MTLTLAPNTIVAAFCVAAAGSFGWHFGTWIAKKVFKW